MNIIKLGMFFIVMTIIGFIADVGWFKYRYLLQLGRILPYAILINILGWGALSIGAYVNMGHPERLAFSIFAMRFFLYKFPVEHVYGELNFNRVPARGRLHAAPVLVPPLLFQLLLLTLSLNYFFRNLIY